MSEEEINILEMNDYIKYGAKLIGGERRYKHIAYRAEKGGTDRTRGMSGSPHQR
jgi:hypothetical protein